MDNFTRLYTTLVQSQHDMRVIHWQAKGKQFDRNHGISEDYQYVLNRYLDEVAELLVLLNIPTPQLHELELADPIDILGEESDFKKMKWILERVSDRIEDILIEEKTLQREFVSKLEEFKYYLQKEIRYKLAQRLK